MNSSTTVAPGLVPSHHIEEAPACCEEVPTTLKCVTSLPWSESEGDDPESREVSFVDLSAFAENEDLSVGQDVRSPTVSTAPTPFLFDHCFMEEDEEAFLTEDEDIAELVAMTEELGFTFEEICEKDDFFVRSDSPDTDPKTDEIQTAFPEQGNAARIVPQTLEANAEDKENKPPPKWSPARIARDLQLASPLFAHATSVTELGGKASNSSLVRVPFTDITNMVIGELEKKNDVLKKTNAPSKNGFATSAVNAKRNKHRPALRMLR